ncbi:MAG: hypothetical protein HZY79_09500 [Rhodoblastus sp.]|nr:MAG: hypothetical protein HZY79_09500 [Rhodoblastus sp.]
MAIGLLSLPFASESADAASGPLARPECPMASVSLDGGYGLSRTDYRPACP